MRLLYINNNSTSSPKEIPGNIIETMLRDLDILKLSERFRLDGSASIKPKELLKLMTDDSDNILFRQQLSKNLFENDLLYNDLSGIYQKMKGLQDISDDMTQSSKKEISNYIKVVNWLDLFCTLTSELTDLFEKHKEKITAESLIILKKFIDEIYTSEEFAIINKNIKIMKTHYHKLNSIKMGVNLNEYYEPISVNCLEISDNYYYPCKIADIIKNDKKVHGIGKFKYQPAGRMKQGDLRYDEMRAQTLLADTTKMQRLVSCEINVGYLNGISSFVKTLNFNSRRIVKEFILEKMQSIIELVDDLGFILGGINMIKQLRDKGMDVCLPEIGAAGGNIYNVENLYNCYLPFIMENPSENIVCNNIDLDSMHSFSILNGPNKGGKTTLIQAMCLSVIMFQLGLYIPCKKAVITPVDMILTHYQREETVDRTGRLALEAESIKMIFSNATENSLIILNEPYVSTSPAEGQFLIMNTLTGIRELRCRGIIVTHYHKLNEKVETENSNYQNKITFLNMGIEASDKNSRRTYELKKGRGEVKSFAMDILREYAPGLLE